MPVAQERAVRTQGHQSVLDAELTTGGKDMAGHAASKRHQHDAMRPGWRMNLFHALESAGTEAALEARQRRPQTPVDERHLAHHQPADEYVRGPAHGPRQREELVASRMTPPAPSWPLPEDGLQKGWNRPLRCLQHNAVVSDETDCLVRCHRWPNNWTVPDEFVASA
jgi:hypothetical protein